MNGVELILRERKRRSTCKWSTCRCCRVLCNERTATGRDANLSKVDVAMGIVLVEAYAKRSNSRTDKGGGFDRCRNRPATTS